MNEFQHREGIFPSMAAPFQSVGMLACLNQHHAIKGLHMKTRRKSFTAALIHSCPIIPDGSNRTSKILQNSLENPRDVILEAPHFETVSGVNMITRKEDKKYLDVQVF
jgi:hypothetical protein